MSSRKKDSASRRHRAQTFSGLPTDCIESLLEVPFGDYGGGGEISSNGEVSSPETAPEQKNDKNVKKTKKTKKKNRSNRSFQSPSSDSRDTKRSILSSDDGGKIIQRHALTSPRIEKAPSFKKRSKPENIERVTKDIGDFKEHKRTNSRSESKTSDRGVMEYNIVLLGDLGVGKTALAVRFVTRRYLHEYDPSLERTYEKTMSCDDEQVMVRLWDTVNKNWENYLDQVDGFIMLYSITSSQSAVNAQNTVNSIRSSRNSSMKTIPILLTGNKSELESARKVPKEEMAQFAIDHNVDFKECSIACTMNIDGMVRSLIRKVQKQQGGRTTPLLTENKLLLNQQALARKPSNAKYLVKNFLSKKEKKKSHDI